ncbi:UBC-like protein [Xylariomycetidae sp. FL2044]|nr:UBC-like protein [Xylariomycetidae sp. FL2044]
MATPKFNSKSPTIRRILKEAAELTNSPSPEYTAAPLETDLFEWHFTIRGPPNSSYADGIYHGRITLPPSYPLAPPNFRFITPSGRFEPNREICLSISGHHRETWQPAWGIRTAIVALRTFMETDAKGQIGGIDTTDAVRRRFATDSRTWKCPVCSKTNGEIVQECEERYKEYEAENGGPSEKRREVEVPAELKMGYRDDMEKEGKAAGERRGGGDATEVEGEEVESAQLAEGFVQTAPDSEIVSPPPSTYTTSQPPRPAQGVPSPTGGVPLPNPIGQGAASTQARNLQQQVRPSDNGVPAWVDYAIVSLVVLLVAVVANILLREGNSVRIREY